MNKKIIGKVTATEKQPTTCNTLRFWIDSDVVVRPFDIVKIQHIVNKSDKPSFTYAIIQNLEYITDSAGHLSNFVSSDFGNVDIEPHNLRIGTTIAEAEVLYNTQEIEMPIRDNAAVEWADVEGVKIALGLSDFKNPLPAGYISMSNGEEIPIDVEAQYLLGPEGAHLNIAGISGLATKTSYVMFLLNSIQQKMNDKVTMVIFNVKGNDLLAIDEDNEDITENQQKEWKKCGLDPIPFKNVTYLYPYGNRPKGDYTLSHVEPGILKKQIEQGKAFNYYYDVQSGKNKLAMLFSDIDDPNSTMESISHIIGDQDFNSWEDLKEFIKSNTSKGESTDKNISVLSWRKFSRLYNTRTDMALFTEKAITQTDKKRQKLVREAILGLNPGDILVIDIEPLPDYLQCLVFGEVVDLIYKIKLGDEEDVEPDKFGKMIIFADELNKYAPKQSEGRKTLTQNILEITERGRSLGVVLFGAEQFRSGVHERVLGNCSTNVYGRTSPIEIEKCPDYRYFPNTYKASISRLPQGSLLLQHAVFKTALVKVKFPYPAYHRQKG